MDNKKFFHKLMLLAVVAFCFTYVACKKDNNSTPAVNNVRLLDSTKRDSSITTGQLGDYIVIQGHGFSGLQQVLFNNASASFNSALNSDQNITIQIPVDAPNAATDPNVPNTLQVITDHGSATYKFTLVLPPPAITSIDNENALPGSPITITGSYYRGIQKITFPGNIDVTNFAVNADFTAITVTVPAITTSGPLAVVGIFGTTKTPFPFASYLGATTGFLANFEDGDPYMGWQWWGGIKTNAGFPNNTGNMIEVAPAGLPVNAGDGTWYADNRAVMVAENAWVAQANMSDPIGNYALKFEMNAKKTSGNGSFMIVPAGNFNLMARYVPAVTNGWVTVVIPLTSFLKNSSGSYDPKGTAPTGFADFTKDANKNSASLQLMLYNDSADPLTAFDVAVDNVRIVKIK
jgi:hypothetical protein